MSVNLSIKDVPEALAERLRQRAAKNRRSLQRELMVIVEQAVAEGPIVSAPEGASIAGPTAAAGASRAGAERTWVQGWKTVEQLMAEREAAGWKPDPSMAKAPRAVDIIRADRDSR